MTPIAWACVICSGGNLRFQRILVDLMGPYTSYIVAFRQFSIVIGAVLAFRIYKEKGLAVRISGALLITAGLVLIAVFGGLMV